MPPSPFSSISHFCIFSGEKLTLILYQLMHRPNGPSHLRFSRPRPLLGRQSLRPLHPADHGARRRLAMAHGQALQIYRLSTDMVYRYDWIDWILAGSVTAQHPHKKWCPEGGRWGWPVREAGFTNYWCKSGRAKNIIFRCFDIWPRTSIFFYGFHVFLHPYGLPARVFWTLFPSGIPKLQNWVEAGSSERQGNALVPEEPLMILNLVSTRKK